MATVDLETRAATTPVPLRVLPARLHHHAYVTSDQEKTRHFYEDILGLPLVATWIESSQGKVYSHTFFGIGDGGALAFFQFDDPDQAAAFAAKQQPPFVHLALAANESCVGEIKARLTREGISAREIDHGYCRSLYIVDPNGLTVEFTIDPPDAAAIDSMQRETARATLERWTKGDRTPNNDFRHG